MKKSKVIRGKHTIKGKILKVSLATLLTYAVGLILIIGFIFPKNYIELQEQLNLDILMNANQNFSEMLDSIYREYEGMLNDTTLMEALEEINRYHKYSETKNTPENLTYLRAKEQFAESKAEIVFMAAKTIADFFCMIGDTTVGVSDKDRTESDIPSIAEYLNHFEETETVFLCTDDIPEYGGKRVDFVISFPMYDSHKEVLGRVCFFLNQDKKYVVWGEDELILLNGENQIMFSSGSTNNFAQDDFLPEKGQQYEREINGMKYLVASSRLDPYNWKIVHVLSMSRFQQTVNEIIAFTCVAIIVVFLLAFLFMGSMSRMISYNIEKVTEGMDSFLGEAHEHTPDRQAEKKWMDLTNRFSLKQKLWIYYSIMIIFPMILITAMVYGKCRYIIETEYEKNASILSDYSYQIIENRLYDDTYALRTILLDSSLMEKLYCYVQSEEEEEKKELYYDIAMKIQTISKECEISYYDTDGNFVLSWPNMQEQKKRNLTININYNEKTIWDDYSRKYSFYVVRRMYMKSNQYSGDMGYLALQIHEDALYGILKNMNSEIEYSFADKQKCIFASSNSEELGTILDQDGMAEKGICYYEEIAKYGIAVCIMISDGNMRALQIYLLELLLLWTLGIMIVVVLEVRRIYVDIMQPITMVNHALLTKEEIDLNSQKGDELDALILSVDRMKKRINSLIDELYENEIITRELEMKVFRAQVTPHFLCNTLERIAALIDMGDERAEILVVLLGKFFRQGISQDKLMITLEELSGQILQDS